MNLLFITYPRADEPFVVAYDLDHPEPEVKQWRADKDGVKYGVQRQAYGMKGVWGYLRDDMWIKLTQAEAYARFPALQDEIELYEAVDGL